MSPEDVTAVLYRYLADGSADESLDAVAAKLVHQSKLQGSEDNITAIVIFLRDVKDIKENSAKFMANPSLSAQNQDFLSMNGNMKTFDVGSNSDIPFAKPTVLELNATSSKKWKNSANVMSSAGIGSDASYQYVENVESSLESSDISMVDSSHVFMSHQKVAASCFAPEATALSELPTPPIDDMLASQQYDSFYSTDLYKDLNSSQSSGNLQSVDSTNPVGLNEFTQLPNVNSPAQPVNELITSIDSMSLHDIESSTNMSASEELSPNEAVGIASTVVSTTIETAVKCLSKSENQETVPVQSPIKLNPYAKPFVMKSFFNPEESNLSVLENPVYEENVQKEATSGNLVDIKVEESSLITRTGDDSQFISVSGGSHLEIDKSVEPPTEESNLLFTDNLVKENPLTKELDKAVAESLIIGDNPSVGDEIASDCLVVSDDQSVKDSKPSGNTVLQDLLLSDNVVEQNTVSITENKNQLLEEGSMIEQFTQNNSCLNNDDLLEVVNIEHSINKNTITTAPEEISNQKSEDIKSENVQQIHQEITSSDSIGFELEGQNINTDLNKADECITCEKELLKTSVEIKSVSTDVISPSSADIVMNPVSSINLASEVKSGEQEQLTEISTPCATSSEISSIPESNQIIDISNVSAVLTPENTTASISESESKSENVEKEKCEVSNSSQLLESITKESISLISIKDELLPAGVEVPSDPSVEESRAETVAVDLKSLPDGIPEAEGVTEDVDSDSEKDGGWSYMKGGNISGNKIKPDNKASNPVKSTEVKVSTASKMRKDVLKSNLDSKNKPKTISADKTKASSLVDKNKNTTMTNKSKTVALADKTKASIDKKSVVDKKTDIKSKVLKTSSATTITTRIADKTSRVTTASTIKKEVTETSKTFTASRSARPTTLQRTGAPSSKPVSGSLADRSTASSRVNTKSNVSVPMKPKVDTSSENKSSVKTTASSTLSKGLPSAQSKPSTTAPRSALTRPTTTIPSKTSTMSKSASLQKTTSSESKPKPAISPSMRKPLTSTMRKPDVNKEVKDSVNKQISAKKNITASKIESSTSTVASRRVATLNNRSTVSKTSSSAAKSELSKKYVPRVPPLKAAAKNPSSLSEKINKSKDKNTVTVQSKTDQTKNSLNIESDQKIVSEMVQVAEEKFILENSDKEIISKEGGNSSNDKQEVFENGSLSESVTPVVEDKTPAAACSPESL